ncbi:MAG: fatty acid desaturase, partial [Vallitaleaceae bacterium]|nr:fatty acid desaturase [Vallitaleaceae bacterium]
LKTYMKRDNAHGLLHVGSWFVMLIALGTFAYYSTNNLVCIIFFLFYGVLYSSCNAIWHECSHGTPFKTMFINEVVFFITTAMEQRDIVLTRWSHAKHHSYTSYTDYDVELSVKRPPNLWIVILNIFNIKSGIKSSLGLISHSFGILSPVAKDVVPTEEHNKLFFWSRITLLTYIITIISCIIFKTWLPLLLYGLPRYYGGFVQGLLILTQHAGLDQNVADHRLNSRTIYLNPILGYLYMNMQYHVEHHIYPSIPFYQLPKLHQYIKNQLPNPYYGLLDTYKELIKTLLKQRKDVNYFINRRS